MENPKQKTKGRKKRGSAFPEMATRIPSLDSLLCSGGRTEGHIVYTAASGLFGVIIGAAGTGKSVLSLQLCCQFVRQHKKNKVLFLSQEPFETIHAKIFETFEFLDGSELDRVVRRETELFEPDGRQMAIVQMPVEPAAQRSKIDYLLQFLRGPRIRKHPHTRLLVCFDNAETIQPEMFRAVLGDESAGEKPNHYKRLREHCAETKLNTWWVFEEEPPEAGGENSTATIASTPQAYAADIVIRLSARELPNTSYRERDIEIIKARHQAYRRGRHAISIFNAKDSPVGTRRKPITGVVVWPSPAAQLSRIRRQGSPIGPSHRLGITGVDKAVAGEHLRRSNGSLKVMSTEFRYLKAGSVSVLVSDLDSLATEIALQFAMQDKEWPSVVLTTASNRKTINQTIAQYHFGPRKPDIHYFAPDYTSEGRLLWDIDQAIGKARRVVFDNLFALGAKFPLIRDTRTFTSGLFGLLRARGVASLVVDLVEVGEGRNPLSESFAAGLADHVFLLRHVEFQSRVCKVFHVLKLSGHHEPPHFWELKQGGVIEAVDQLEFYKGVLSGRPEPLEITLSLFADAEGSPLDLYLQMQNDLMVRTFGQRIKVNVCHPVAYGTLQQGLATGGLRPLGDCHVISIDEIWLKELISSGLLASFPRGSLADPGQTGLSRWDHGEYVTTGVNIAARTLASGSRSLKRLGMSHDMFVAVPDINNVGILAYNPNVWNQRIAVDGDPAVLALDLPVLRTWATGVIGDLRRRAAQGGGQTPPPPTLDEVGGLAQYPWERPDVVLTWQDLAELQGAFIRHLGENEAISGAWLAPSTYREWEDWEQPPKEEEKDVRRFKDGREVWNRTEFHAGDSELVRLLPRWGVFTASMNQRESCVSFLLELLLSLLPANAFPVDDDGQLVWDLRCNRGEAAGADPDGITPTFWGEALALMLRLLSPWDILRLSHGWFRSPNDERPCLFSRQWFSCWGALGLREPGLCIKELPPGADGIPTPVSGAWYLGILRDSTAVRAGVNLIKHLTSESVELFKVNRGIGMPVRARFYGARAADDPAAEWTDASCQPLEVRTTLPYRGAFVAMRNRLATAGGQGSAAAICSPEIMKSRCPFYRSVIDDYAKISPLLMGMISTAAKAALDWSCRDWMWSRNTTTDSWGRLRVEIERVVVQAAQRCKEVCPPKKRRRAPAGDIRAPAKPAGSSRQTRRKRV